FKDRPWLRGELRAWCRRNQSIEAIETFLCQVVHRMTRAESLRRNLRGGRWRRRSSRRTCRGRGHETIGAPQPSILLLVETAFRHGGRSCRDGFRLGGYDGVK